MKRVALTLTLLSFIFLNAFAQDIQVPTEQFSFITKKTATWCPICGGAAWDSFRNMIDDNEQNAVLVAAHFDDGSQLYSETAEQLVNNFETSFGQPVFFHNRNRLSGRGAATVADVRDRTRNAYDTNPTIQTGIRATIQREGTLLSVETKTAFFSSAEGTYHLSIYPILKSVEAVQSSRGNDEHKMILLDEITGNTFGKVIAEGSTASGVAVEETFEITDNALIMAALDENLQLAAVIWKEDNGSFEFVNAYRINTMGEETVSSNRNYTLSGLTWNIQSGTTLATLALDATQPQKEVEITIYAMNGKKTATLYQGNLSKGLHQFQFSGHTGIQVATIRVGNQINSKTFFIQ